jgi:uncharacterized damage-inducible protein DinB
MSRIAATCVLTLLSASVAFAQTTNPITASVKAPYEIVKGYITKSAAKVPEEHYAFKASPDVRTFGQILGHIADSNYGICAAAIGEKSPVSDIEKTKTTKADLAKALADSFAYCDKALAGMTDAKGAETVPFLGGQQMARLGVLGFNNNHDFEHYGNLVTYMRIKGIVPPSSERSSSN